MPRRHPESVTDEEHPAMTAVQRAQSGTYSVDEMLRFHAEARLDTYGSAPEKMRYAFLHMSEFMRHSVIQRCGPIRELPDAGGERRREMAGLRVSSRRGAATLDDYVHDPASQVDGIVVLHAGRLVYEAYPRMRPLDKHILWSVTKAYVGTLIAVLEDRGQLDSSRPLDAYLPEVRGSGWQGVAVRDILDMASGIDAREQTDGAMDDPAHPYYQFEASIGYLAPTAATPASTYAYVAGLPRRIPPGTVYEYTSVDTFMLAWLAERVSGLALNELLAQEIWSSIGAEADGLLSMSPHGAPGADGGISAALRDVARFGLLFTPSVRAGTPDPLVSDAYLDKIRRGGRREVFLAGGGAQSAAPFGDDAPLYNSWQWDRVWADGDFYKGGWGGQGLHISPARDAVIAFFGTPGAGRVGNELPVIARFIVSALG
jgi:CubicO group peptidase (beta-lactamase class C family)